MVGIHIVDAFTGATEWPNRDGRFNLANFGRDFIYQSSRA